MRLLIYVFALLLKVQTIDVGKYADQAGWANEIAALDQPLLIKNAPLHLWPARNWTPENLVDRLPSTLKAVKRTTSANGTFHYCHGGPMVSHDKTVYHAGDSVLYDVPLQTTVPGLTSAYEARCYSSVDMPTKEFMERIRQDPDEHPGGFTYSYSSTIDQWPEVMG